MASQGKGRGRDRDGQEGSQPKRKHTSQPTESPPKGASCPVTQDNTLQALQYLLDSKVFVQDPATANMAGRAGPGQVGVAPEELPHPPFGSDYRMKIKLQSLFLYCYTKEVDIVRYCIGCYSRACGQSRSKWAGQDWTPLFQATQEAALNMTLQQLIDGATAHSGDDLWSSLYGTTVPQVLTSFLSRLSGWSEDGVQLPSDMLQKLITMAKETALGRTALLQLVKAAGTKVKTAKRLDEMLLESRSVLEGLDILMANATFAEIVSESLIDEVKDAITNMGHQFEKKSVLSGLLSVTAIMDKLNPLALKDERYSCFTGLRNFPTVNAVDAINAQTAVQDGLHRCQKTLHTVLLKMLKSPNRTNVVAWMSAMVSLNELRAGPRFKKGIEAAEGTCSDGFMLNFCAVLLELCKPFFASHPSGEKLALISRDYPTSPLCRLDHNNETCFAGGIINGSEARLSQGHERFLATPPQQTPPPRGGTSPTPFKFVTECFFITQRALHVGLIPAVNTFTNLSSELHKQQQGGVTGRNEDMLKLLSALYQLSWTSCLLDPQFVQYCCEFYVTQAVWITRQLESCKQAGLSEEQVCEKQRSVMAGLPEFGVKDMASWFRFVVLSRPILLQGLQLTPFVDCCVCLLDRPDLLPSPLSQGRLISVLLAFINSDKRQPQAGRLLRAEGWSGILGELSVMVQASPMVRDRLGPALLHTYAAVKVFEGLDVDKEDFDKYAARYEITQLLHRLWARLDCRDSLLRQCGSKKFQDFLSAIFDTLLYQLNDALSRLGKVKRYETDKEAGNWDKLPSKEKQEKERFLSGEQRVSKGFMTQANTQMELLYNMSEAELVAKCLCDPSLAKRTAAAMVGFLDALCGPSASQLKVKDMDKYAFDPKRLLVQITTIVLRVWKQDHRPSTPPSPPSPSSGGGGSGSGRGPGRADSFTVSLATHPDYSAATMTKCGSVLQKQMLGDPAFLSDFNNFVKQVEQLQSPSDALPSPSSPSGSGVPMSPQATPTSPSTVDHDWERLADATEIVEDGLREVYVSALEVCKYDSTELIDVHTLAEKVQQTLDPRSPKVKAIMRDMKQLEESLPIHPDSAIFLRQDEDHMDLVRVLITGPAGTPYGRGCFIFDIFYPVSYPTNPPLVVMTTTGGGTVRFNPNLYADGKVCLSLLGTWHGGDATEKWDPLRSNLLQVLLSIQGMIFIPDPMFNEPGYEAIRGTAEGNAQSTKYNSNIQVYTVRYAMLEQLRNPPKGFEDVIQVHFAIQREAIMKQLSQWVKEVISPEHERRLRKAIDEFRAEMDKL